MRLFDRLSKGWALGKTSLKTIQENPALMLFPVISGASLILVSLSFFGGGYFLFGEKILPIADNNTPLSSLDIVSYLMLFLFYIANYFVIVFFNVGLVRCARIILEGGDTNFTDGFQYARTRIGTILAWALMAATVGIILKTIQERVGTFGSIIYGIIGLVWGIATFFVVPVIAYEDVDPFEAVKRSAQVMKEKWGESIGASFSFGLFALIGIILIALPLGFLVGFLIDWLAGAVVFILAFILVQIVVSAANMVFTTAAYQHVNHRPVGGFDDDVLENIFVKK